MPASFGGLTTLTDQNPINYSTKICVRFLKPRFRLRLAMLIFWLAAVPALISSCNPATPPPASQSRYFSDTGFTVQGDFLLFFDNFGGTESLGRPISAEMTAGGWRVQYFEKGRLEYHPENEPAYRVTVGWLGDLLQRRRPPIPASSIPAANQPAARYFAVTGHTLSGDFLSYFEANGGSVRFGLPISEPYLLDGRLTQDLQSARFFWSPASSSPVTLEDIGRTHFERLPQNK